jgi:beta-barrel assembly-enhancing protease
MSLIEEHDDGGRQGEAGVYAAQENWYTDLMDLTAFPLFGRRAFFWLAAALALGTFGRCAAAKAPPAPPAASAPAAAGAAAPTVATSTSSTPDAIPEAAIYLPTVEEIKLGREGAAEAEKEYKLVQDETQLKRLKTIGTELIRAANDPEVVAAYPEAYKLPEKMSKSKRVPFQWTYKVVKSPEINAFSLAGGPIYFTTGLLGYVRSDDELAAVMSHEMTHVLHHHVLTLGKREAKAEQKMLWVMLASILAGAAGGPNMSNALIGAQLYAVAKQNGYGREAEKDADHNGVLILLHSRYNPVGMLTFMSRLARDEDRRPPVEMGIYQSHPYTKERAELISGYLTDAGIKVDRGVEREVSNAFQVSSQTAQMAGHEVGEVLLNGQLLFRPAVTADGQSPSQRASAIAEALRRLLQDNLRLHQVRLDTDHTTVVAAGVPLVHVLPGDAALEGSAVPDLAQKVLAGLQNALWKEQIDRGP